MQTTRLRERLAPGLGGVGRTVQLIRHLITEGGADPDVILHARQVLSVAPERDSRAELRALFDHVQRSVRYVHDPLNAETMVDAPSMVDRIETEGMTSEDCDGLVVLLGSLLEAVGYETEVQVESFRRDGEPSHVVLLARLGTKWTRLDPTCKAVPMGDVAVRPRRAWGEGQMIQGSTAGGGTMMPRQYRNRAPVNRVAMLGVLPPERDAVQQLGLTEEQTAQGTDSNWMQAFSGVITGIGGMFDQFMGTPFGQAFAMQQHMGNVEDLAKIGKKYGFDAVAAYFGPGGAISAVAPAKPPPAPKEEGEPGEGPLGIPLWGWGVGIGAVALFAIALS